MIGRTLAHFEITAKLGEGGMGEVYRATDTRLGREVAVKVLPQDFVADEERLARFEREARVLASLSHSNIAGIFEVGEQDEAHFLVMELAEGETLAERIARGPMPVDEAVPVALQIAAALETAHENGIIHRDLKPANVKVTQDGQVKLLDFGLARALEPAGPDADEMPTSESPTLTARMTGAHVLLGTAAYMSPEQARRQPVDKRADIWAFGVLLWEMLTGRRLFEGASVTDVLAEVVRKEPDLEALPRETSPVLRQLLRRCLDRDVKNRLRDIGEARYVLSRSGAEAASRPAERAVRPGRSTLLLLAASVAAVALVLLWVFRQPTVSVESLAAVEQLTANPIEFAVTGGTISPQGDSVVFADARGLHLRYVSTGETRRIDLGDNFQAGRVWWFPDQSRLLVSGRKGDAPLALWLVNPLGGQPRRIHEGVFMAAISPAGDQLAVIRHSGERERTWREIWLMNADGSEAREFLTAAADSSFWWLAWSPDGGRLAYGSWGLGGSSIETRRVSDGGDPTVLLAEQRLFQNWTGILPFVWSRDGRLVFGRREEGRNRRTSNLWSVQTDVQRGQRQGNPVRVTRLAGVNFRDLSITADGSMLSALLVRNQADVYLGELASDAGGLESVRQLTFDERDDYPSGWTPDSAGLLLSSSRLGSDGVFKWSRDTESLQLVSERGNRAVSTTDGSWILLRREGGIEALPAEGGPARMLTGRARSLACSRAPEPACVVGFSDGEEYVFNSLNPFSGEVEELIRISHRPPFTNWSLTPDSRRVAVVHGDDNVVRIIDLKDGGEIALEVEGWSGFEFVAWAADGESLFLNSGLSFAGDFAVLLQVGMDGRAQVLRDAPNVWHVYPVPSPDGRYLAFAGMPFHGNIWLIRDF